MLCYKKYVETTYVGTKIETTMHNFDFRTITPSQSKLVCVFCKIKKYPYQVPILKMLLPLEHRLATKKMSNLHAEISSIIRFH